jgi:hypothetical protein
MLKKRRLGNARRTLALLAQARLSGEPFGIGAETFQTFTLVLPASGSLAIEPGDEEWRWLEG